jgi:hypothetical protein
MQMRMAASPSETGGCVGAEAERRFWASARRKLLLVVLGLKAVTFLIALGAITFFPAFDERQYQNVIHWPREGPPTLATYFTT